MKGGNLKLVVVKNGFDAWDWNILGMTLTERMRRIAEIHGLEFQSVESLEDVNLTGSSIVLTRPILFDFKDLSTLNQHIPESGCVEVYASTGEFTGIYLCNGGGLSNANKVSLDFCFVDVATEGVKTAERFLLKKLIKPSDGPISRLINRRISIPISRLLVRTSLTPNMLSLMSFILALVAAAALALGTKLGLLIGGIMAEVASILDGCDGEIARLKLMFSEFGAWFDRVLDRYADILIIAALSTAAMGGHPETAWMWGLIAAAGSLLMSYTANICDIMYLNGIPIRLGRDLRLFIVFFGGLFGKPFETLIVISFVSHIEVIRRIGAFAHNRSCIRH